MRLAGSGRAGESPSPPHNLHVVAGKLFAERFGLAIPLQAGHTRVRNWLAVAERWPEYYKDLADIAAEELEESKLRYGPGAMKQPLEQ